MSTNALWVRSMCVCLLFGSAAGVRSADLFVGPASVLPGGTASVSVLLSPPQGSSIAALQFDLVYDPTALSVATAAAGSAAVNAGMNLYANNLGNGVERFLIVGLNQAAIPQGSVVDLAINPAAGAISGAYPLQIQNVAASDPSGNAVLLGAANGTVGVGSVSPPTIFNVNPPLLSVVETHKGNFLQGQNQAAFTVTVSNAPSAGATGDTVTVTEAVPQGLTLASMAGSGWTCAANTCMRGDSLAPGAAYPLIAGTVNVAPDAASPLVNTAAVSGGGSASASAADSIAILPSFVDVSPSDPNFDAVNLMRQYSITAGCSASPPMYCPNDNISRAQMAIFLVRSVLGGDNFAYSSTPYFNDVPSGAFGFQWIQKLWELGITAGCGNGNFCPDTSVDLEQMAVFVIRARLGAAADGTFTYPATPYFTDVPASSIYFKWIQRMKLDQITAGCGDGTTYCPQQLVTRGLMATLVIRGAFNELLPPSTPLLTSVSPAIAPRGQTTTITVFGADTGFDPGASTVDAGPGVAVGTIAVLNSTTLTVRLTVAPDAVAGPRTILVTTGSQQAVLPNGLIVQ